MKLGTKIRKGIDNLHIASTDLDCSARWYSYVGGLNLGLCPVDGESQRLCFFMMMMMMSSKPEYMKDTQQHSVSHNIAR